MKLFELASYQSDPDLRAVRPIRRTFARGVDAFQAVRHVCEVFGVAEPGLVSLSLFTGTLPTDAVVLN